MEVEDVDRVFGIACRVWLLNPYNRIGVDNNHHRARRLRLSFDGLRGSLRQTRHRGSEGNL